jgi:hypothetical protein
VGPPGEILGGFSFFSSHEDAWKELPGFIELAPVQNHRSSRVSE